MGAKIIKFNLNKLGLFSLLLMITLIMGSAGAIAGSAFDAELGAANLSTVSENIVDSSSRLPGLISALSYLMGILFGAWAILKLKDHVENPAQTRLSEVIARFLAGGALLALPIVFEAMQVAYGQASSDGSFNFFEFLSGIVGVAASWVPAQGINGILASIIQSVEGVPGIVSAFSYLFGLVLGVAGILKLKEHIENPTQVQMKEPVVRFLAGGALFSLPTIFAAMHTSLIGDGTGILDYIGQALGVGNIMYSAQTGGLACDANGIPVIGPVLAMLGGGGGDSNIGSIMCRLIANSASFPAFLSAIAYLFGVFLGVWGIIKIKEHALNPQQVQLWDGVVRLLAGGAMFALPELLDVARNTIGGTIDELFGLAAGNTGFTEGVAGTEGLDVMMARFVESFFGPMTVLMNFFGLVAGTILVMIAIMRLLKAAQEGPRGPGGIGTLMTFIAGGALLSFTPMVTAFSVTLFNDPQVATTATLSYEGMEETVQNHAVTIINAIYKFMIVLGLISFARGIFIVRGVAEGSQQASMMAGLTHLLGGALAINLGPLINAVQATLGITGYGIGFS